MSVRKTMENPDFDPALRKVPFPPSPEDYAAAEARAPRPAPKADEVDVVKLAYDLDEQDADAQRQRRTEGKQAGFTDTSIDTILDKHK